MDRTIERVKELTVSPVLAVGFWTFFAGFGAGALLNLYLFAIRSPLVLGLRSTLTFKSAIFGDGIILPAINMVAMAYMLQNRPLIKRNTVFQALFLGLLITAYFHISQALGGLVNWAMPTPWHWNLLGLWHALYMFSIASYLSLFYLVNIKSKNKTKGFWQLLVVTIGLVMFFALLRLDYL